MRPRQPLSPRHDDDARSGAVHAALLFVLAALAFLGAVNLGERARDERAETTPPDVSLLPDPQTLEVLALGYETFLADMIWVRALQHHKIGKEQRLMPHFLDAVLHLDPDFKSAYRFAGTAMLFAGGAVTRDNVEASNRYLARGMERYPDEAYYPYTIGLNWAFYMPAANDDEKAAHMRTAVDYLHVALQKPDVQPGIALLIAGLMKYHEDPSQLVDFLEQAYVSEPDPEVRRKIEQRLDALAGGDRRKLLEAQRKRLRDWHEANFDYLPPGLAYHVGERLSFSPVPP